MALGIWGDIWGPIWGPIWAAAGGNAAPTVTIVQGATISVAVGKTKFLSTTTTGTPAPTVSWSSADALTVTVSGAGAITGVAEGVANVTATADNDVEPNGTDVIEVTVTAATGVSGSRATRRRRRG